MKHLQKQDEEKIMELHYIGGIDFPLFHKANLPNEKGKTNPFIDDIHGKQFVRRDIYFNRRHLHQRG